MHRANAATDRRAFGRRESRIHAIARIAGRPPEPCVVRNYSDTGALIAFQGELDPPERFRLVIEAKGIDVMCAVRRRQGSEIGVSFVDAADALTEDLERAARTPAVAAIEAPRPVPEFGDAPKLLVDGPPVVVVSGDEMRRRMSL